MKSLRRSFWMFFLIAVLISLSACASPTPTPTPIPPTATPVPPTATPVPTDTPVPPTDTPAPTDTPEPTNTPEPVVEALPLAAEPVRSEMGGVAIGYPDGWATAEMLGMIFIAPDEAALEADEIDTNVIMVIATNVEELAEEGIENLDDVEAQLDEIVSETTQGMEVVAYDRTKLAGKDTLAVHFAGTDDATGQEMAGRLLISMFDDRVAMIISVSPADMREDFAPTLDAMLETVEFFELKESVDLSGLQAEEVELEAYTNSKLGFRVGYPSDWEVEEDEEQVTFSAPDTLVGIFVDTRVLSKEMPPAEIADIFIAGFKEEIETLEVSDATEEEVDGYPAVVVEGAFERADNDMRTLLVAVARDNVAYSIMLVSTAEDYDWALELFGDKFMDGFNFIKMDAMPTPAPTQPPEVELEDYANSELGFRVKYPADWEVEENEKQVIFSPPGAVVGFFVSATNLGTTMEPMEVADIFMESFVEKTDNFEIVETAEEKVDGYPAAIVGAKYDQAEGAIGMLLVAVARDNVAYSIMMMSGMDDYTWALDIFTDRFLDSFNFIEMEMEAPTVAPTQPAPTPVPTSPPVVQQQAPLELSAADVHYEDEGGGKRYFHLDLVTKNVSQDKTLTPIYQPKFYIAVGDEVLGWVDANYYKKADGWENAVDSLDQQPTIPPGGSSQWVWYTITQEANQWIKYMTLDALGWTFIMEFDQAGNVISTVAEPQ